MTNKQKLELTWIGKEKRPKLEPRILLEDPSLSYHARHRVSDNDSFDNRLEIIRRLLSEDGSLWITIDDNEAHYLKVLCDEVFGRANFVTNAIWQKKYSPQNDAKWLSDNHDHILVYAKNKISWRPNLLPRSDSMNARYRNPDNDPRGPWKPADFL